VRGGTHLPRPGVLKRMLGGGRVDRRYGVCMKIGPLNTRPTFQKSLTEECLEGRRGGITFGKGAILRGGQVCFHTFEAKLTSG